MDRPIYQMFPNESKCKNLSMAAEEGPWLELDREEEVMWPLGKEEVKCHMDLE